VRWVLRGFQDTAVTQVAKLLAKAAKSVREGDDQNWAIGLTATTGSGKTVIATALIEHILCGSEDSSVVPDTNAVFLWFSDMPALNKQSRAKMLKSSNALTSDRLVLIESTFDEPELLPGRDYFINAQLLGSKGIIVGPKSPRHQFPFWETVAATIAAEGRTLYFIVDEAHRGMGENANDRKDAKTIVQKFIKGIDGVMPPVPVLLGISATPAKYRAVVDGTGRIVASHDVKPEDVRKSGLIKDRILTAAADERQRDPFALLRQAAIAWKESTEAWNAYAKIAVDDEPVVPALIIQVQNEEKGHITRTPITDVIQTIVDVVGPLPDSAFVHAFGEGQDLQFGGRTVRFVPAERIAGDDDARVVFFKSGLGTGWDCPRAEVMFSFRKAEDATSIAQTIGRMVRTPLARRITQDDRLNIVEVFLPEYDKAAVNAVKSYLEESGDAGAADAIQDRNEWIRLSLRPGMEKAVAAIDALPSWKVPVVRDRKDVRRLVDLALRLSANGISANAFDDACDLLVTALLDKQKALADDEKFRKSVTDQGTIEIVRVEWAVGEAQKATETTLTLPASTRAIEMLYAGAKRSLGKGDVADAYVNARVGESTEMALREQARLEAWALSQWSGVMDTLNDIAAKRISELFVEHQAAIAALTPRDKAPYETIRGTVSVPTMSQVKTTPTISVKKAGKTWPLHLFADDNGNAPFDFRSDWERVTLDGVIADKTTVAWLRNDPYAEDAALRVTHRDRKSTVRPFYPDFLVVRDAGKSLVVDVLDPHDPKLEDAPSKAVGLAEFARDHGLVFGAIDLIAEVGNSGLRRLHLQDERTREEVLKVKTNEDLLKLYEHA
jgi:type III restriction enzyme